MSLATAGLCLPYAALAAPLPAQRPVVALDVALRDGGILLGQVVDTQAAPLPGVAVSLRDRDRELARTETDRNGYFAVRGLRGGVYQIFAAKGHGAFRLWTPGTAPPAAQQGALLVAGCDTVRAQCGGALRFWLSNPCVLAAAVAAAVAVPVAVHNGRRPSSP